MKSKVQFLTMNGCHSCEEVKSVFAQIMPEFADKIEVEEIDIATKQGQELVSKYGIMASPGIIIEGELFSTGGVDREKLIQKLQTL